MGVPDNDCVYVLSQRLVHSDEVEVGKPAVILPKGIGHEENMAKCTKCK